MASLSPNKILLGVLLGTALLDGCETNSASPSDSSLGGEPASGGTAHSGGAGKVGGSGSGGRTSSGGATGGQASESGGAASGGEPGTGGELGMGGLGMGGFGGDGAGPARPLAGTDAYDCSPAVGAIPPLMLTKLGEANLPVGTAHAPNDDRLFIITLDGNVLIMKDGVILPTPFLSLGETLITGGERGLLGIAFHPDYATNGLFYLHFSANTGIPGTDPGDTVIAEYHVSEADPNIADPSSQRVVLTVDQPDNEQNHKGGSILFGPKKLLFIGLGDGGGGGDNHNPPHGQSVATLLGKMLRIDPLADGNAPYATPRDNLLQNLPAALPEIWDYGLRNPFRTSFDGCTGDLYIADVGQGNYEEVDIERAGDGRRNYGWKITEGLHCYASDTCDRTGITDPLIEYDHSVGTSITGGAVYRGSSIPGLRGAYFYGDYTTNKVWYTFYDRETDVVSNPVSVTQDLNITRVVSISNGGDGELYFISLGTPGGIFRLESAE